MLPSQNRYVDKVMMNYLGDLKPKAVPPNTGCTGRLGLCAFFRLVSELWQFSVSNLLSPQPPIT